MVSVNRKYTIEKVKSILNELGFQLVSNEFISCEKKIVFKDLDGYFYVGYIHQIAKHKPRKFGNDNPFTIQNIKLWCKLNSKLFELVSESYNGNKENLKWKCLKDGCGEEFNLNWDHIYSGNICPYCSGQRVGLSNCLATKNPELAKEWHPTKNGELTPFDFTLNSGQYAWWKCKECGHEWEAVISSRSRKNSNGCPVCKESKGEKKIKIFLKNSNIHFTRQYKFINCRGKNRRLPFDFAIFKDKEFFSLSFLIEYDGILHYEDKFNNPEQFAINNYHDLVKTNYCISNNINLIRIPYWEFNNAESILEDILIHNNLDNKFIVNNKI